jgi:hypothetical protein
VIASHQVSDTGALSRKEVGVQYSISIIDSHHSDMAAANGPDPRKPERKVTRSGTMGI